jgi:hypothetical protein
MRIERITTAIAEANYDWTIVRVESDEGRYARPGEPFFETPE